MYSSYNSCGSSSQEAHFYFDISTLHTLHVRDITTVSASSFIIVITVGFVGLLMICAGSSAYYRRRIARNPPLLDVRQTFNSDTAVQPQLWEVYVAGRKVQTLGAGGEWGSMLPLAMRLVSDQPNVNIDEVSQTVDRRRRRSGRRSRHAQHTYKPAIDLIHEAEVVVLVSLPSASSIPQSSRSVSRTEVDGSSSEARPGMVFSEDHSWSGYVVGVAQVPFQEDGENAAA